MKRSRIRHPLALAIAAALACVACAAATDDPGDASEMDARLPGPGETPWSEAGMVGPPPPSGAPTGEPSGPPTAAPTGAPTGAPTAAPTGPPTAAPTGAPTAAPTGAPTQPPEEPDCVTDADCGGDDMLCFGGFCVVDPAAPQRVGDGACTNDADEAVLRGNPPFRDIATTCGLTCLGQMSPCLENCVGQNAGFSAACGRCYGTWVACVSSLCIIPCVFNDDPGDCLDCRGNLCDRALGTCGGFAAPQQW